MSAKTALLPAAALLIAVAACGGSGPNQASRDMGDDMRDALGTLYFCVEWGDPDCEEAIATMIEACFTVEMSRENPDFLLGHWRNSGRVDQSLAPACAKWEQIRSNMRFLRPPFVRDEIIDLLFEIGELIGD